jgi:hypothetical protein
MAASKIQRSLINHSQKFGKMRERATTIKQLKEKNLNKREVWAANVIGKKYKEFLQKRAADKKSLEDKKQRQIIGGSASAACFAATVATLIYAQRKGIIAEWRKDGFKKNKKIAALIVLSLAGSIGSGAYALTA